MSEHTVEFFCSAEIPVQTRSTSCRDLSAPGVGVEVGWTEAQATRAAARAVSFNMPQLAATEVPGLDGRIALGASWTVHANIAENRRATQVFRTCPNGTQTQLVSGFGEIGVAPRVVHRPAKRAVEFDHGSDRKEAFSSAGDPTRRLTWRGMQ